ncbi:MAG: class I SAM-dependent methyltransferase [Nitrososphaeria archaeon]
MSSSYLLDPFVMTLLTDKGKSYLDIGCGKGKWGYLINTSHKPPSFIVGGDLDIKNIMYAQKKQVYDDVLLFDGRYLPFRDASFDIVLALEVIEHMEKLEGYKLLNEAERVSKEKVIVSTPLLGARYWYSEKEHISRWTVSDLHSKGYIVRGIGFSFFGHFTTYRLAFALAPLAYYIPWMSYILLAWKNLRRKNNIK